MDVTKDIDLSLLNKFGHAQNISLKKLKYSCDEKMNSHKATMTVLHNEYFDKFCKNCDEHYSNLADDLDKVINTKFNGYNPKSNNLNRE